MSYNKLMATWRRRGRPLFAENECERCQALTVMTTWKKLNKREPRCPFVARYSIGKKHFCRHHTVMEAMAMMIERGQVRRIPYLLPRLDQHVPTVKGKP